MLKADLDKALASIEAPPLSDSGLAVIEIPLPADPGDQPATLRMTVKLAPSGDGFSLFLPIGAIEGEALSASLSSLLSESFWPDRNDGVSVAMNPESSILLAVHHWVQPTITPEEFGKLVETVYLGGARLMEITASLATVDAAIKPLLT